MYEQMSSQMEFLKNQCKSLDLIKSNYMLLSHPYQELLQEMILIFFQPKQDGKLHQCAKRIVADVFRSFFRLIHRSTEKILDLFLII